MTVPPPLRGGGQGVVPYHIYPPQSKKRRTSPLNPKSRSCNSHNRLLTFFIHHFFLYSVFTLHARTNAVISINNARKKGAPGRCQSLCTSINLANVSVKRPGPITPVIPMMLLFAPCSCPCCDEGPYNPIKENTGMPDVQYRPREIVRRAPAGQEW